MSELLPLCLSWWKLSKLWMNQTRWRLLQKISSPLLMEGKLWKYYIICRLIFLKTIWLYFKGMWYFILKEPKNGKLVRVTHNYTPCAQLLCKKHFLNNYYASYVMPSSFSTLSYDSKIQLMCWYRISQKLLYCVSLGCLLANCSQLLCKLINKLKWNEYKNV